ncbi:MAG TPA: TIGR02996 domain-containing protein [Gemmataceae bacterium]|nr:TIGR02996 domain-containing protein [Gemmataceae bacterium]
MSDRLAFLRAIRASPGDDTARLAFADWLDEHGEPEQAEFIRVQLELDPVRDRLEDLRTRELIRREEVLEQDKHTPRFGAAFECDDRLMYPEGIGFRGGLPDWLCVSLETLLTRGEQLFAAYPTLRELAVFDIQGRGAELAACPLLAKADVLEVADTLTADDAAELAASPHIRSVREFKLYGNWDFDPELGVRLAQRSTPDWPRRIDMTWIFDGVAAGIDPAGYDPPPDEDESFAYPVNAAAGRELAFDLRPARRLFPLVGYPFDTFDDDELQLGLDTMHGMYVGRLPDGTQAIAACRPEEWILATFDELGIVKAIDRRACPITSPEPWNFEACEQHEAAARTWVTEALHLSPAVVRVREFEASDDFGVHLWPRSFGNYWNYTTRPERTPEHLWRDRGGVLARWLRKRDFVVRYGDEMWADWRGTIHST